MIKILSAAQIRALDAYTIQHEPISSINLMERASDAFVHWFTERIDATHKIGVICGTGNNGGDGLAIARLLKELNYRVQVWIVRGGVNESLDFTFNLNRLTDKKIVVHNITKASDALFDSCDVLIDAIFGTGLSRAPEGLYAQVIGAMNGTSALRVAVDLPSGLQADVPSTGVIVKADYTVSFQLPKLSFLLPQYADVVGEWTTLDIGLSKDFIKSAHTSYAITTSKDCKRIIKPRTTFQHKGNFGHALLIAGSLGKTGAAVLAARAALRAGVGLLTVHIPKSSNIILQISVPEAMTDIDAHDAFTTYCSNIDQYQTVGIGPGIGQQSETINALSKVLTQCERPMVLDADALNILGSHRELLQLIPKGSILTPHPKEFERLVGEWTSDFQRLEKQKELAAKLKCVVLVKGAYTAVATPEGKIYFNSTGNPGMATGGSGDVLTGILTALLAQGYSSTDAARLGVFIHGKAGDDAARKKGMTALIASDIIDELRIEKF